MANQAIALQARVPQNDFMGRAIQQNAQMMNMMAQQSAAERQAMQAQQAMELARVEEARRAELHGPAMDKARSEATAAGIKTGLDFSNFVYTGLSNAADPAQAIQIAQRIGQQPQFQEELFQGALADAMATMPQDPAEFGVWKEEILARTVDGAKRLQRKLIEQTSGDEQRIISVPEYGRGAATEVPGSRIKAPPGITYVKDDAGNIYAMPKTRPGGGFDKPAPSAPGAPAPSAPAAGSADVVYGFGKFAQPPKPLTTMTIGEVQNFQKNDLIPATRGKVGAGPDKGTGAVGTYQITYGTLQKYAPRVLGPNWRNTPFTADVQDRIAKAIYEDVKGGNLKDTWAGLPSNRPGAYSNVPWEQVRGQIAAAESGGGGAPPGRGSAGTGGAPQPVIKGQPKPPKTTEAERRFGTISQQMRTNLQDAVDILTNNPEAIQPSGAEYAASQIPFYGEEAALFMQSQARQQFDASVLRFLDNVTFVNTGAGTSKTQEANYRRSYIPTYQDTKGSAYRKLKSMVEFAKNVKNAAGVLWTPELDADFNALTTAVERLNPAKKGAPRRSLSEIFGGS